MRLRLCPPSRVSAGPSAVVRRGRTRAEAHQVADRVRRLGDERRARPPRRTARRRRRACRGTCSSSGVVGSSTRGEAALGPARSTPASSVSLVTISTRAHRAQRRAPRRARPRRSRARRRRRRAPSVGAGARAAAGESRWHATHSAVRRRRADGDHPLDRRPGPARRCPAGTSTSSVPSRSERSSFVGGDHLHVLADRGAVDRLEDAPAGWPCVSWCSIPVSVATSTLSAVVACGRSTIPLVDRIWVRSVGHDAGRRRGTARTVAQPHSGWMNSSASGFGRDAVAQVGAVDAGVDVALAQPDVHVLAAGRRAARARRGTGRGRTGPRVSAGIERTTSTAFDDVQQMSVSAFTAAVVLT